MQTMTELEFVDLVSCLMRVVWAAAAGKLYLASMGIQVSFSLEGQKYVRILDFDSFPRGLCTVTIKAGNFVTFFTLFNFFLKNR
jgi:hypothetical protein